MTFLLVSTIAQIVAAIIALNFIVRTIVFTTLKHFGAYDPRWDRYWPRLPWRSFWLSGWIKFTEWKEENFSGGAASAGKAGAVTQLASQWEPGHSLIGRVRLPLGIPHYSLIGEKSERHECIIAAARSGKSLQLETKIALLPDDACAVLTDPKGTITNNVLYSLERRGHDLCVLDPMGITNRPTQQINFHTQIDFINERKKQDLTTICCNRIASQFFPYNPNAKNPFFDEMGREGWAKIDCFAKLTIPNSSQLDTRRLVQVGFIEEADGDPKLGMAMLWKAMQECDAYEGYVSSFGSQMQDMDERTCSNILATIRSKTSFLDHEQVKSVSRGNDVNLCDLKDPDKNLIISLPAPVGDMRTTLRPWIGTIISLSLAVMEWIEGDLNPKTQFIIEEAQSISAGALPGLGDTAALMAGMGVQLTIVVQDMAGFSNAFPNDYKSIIGNAQHVIFMATNDHETYEFIASKAFGEKTVKRKKWRIPFLWTVSSWQEPVITPDKVRRYLEAGRGNAIVMRNGKRSMFVKIAKSFEILPVWMLEPSRDHGESAARAWFRSIWQSYSQQSDTAAPDNSAEEPDELPQEPQRTPAYALSREDAAALFGLTAPFSAKEIAARAACLNDNFPRELVFEAKRVLEGSWN